MAYKHDQRIKDAYSPASAVALSPILRLVRSIYSDLLTPFYRGSRFVCKLPRGELYYDSQLATDNDGSPAFTRHRSKTGLFFDAAHQADTAWQPGGVSLDANAVPFISLPLDFNSKHRTAIRKGDLAAVIYNNVVAFAVVGDFGGSKLGEGSIELHRLLGHETIRGGHYFNESIASDVVTIVFPGTSNTSVRTEDSIRAAAMPLYLKLIMSAVASAVTPMIGLPDVKRGPLRYA
jgi:hypothetical protein